MLQPLKITPYGEQAVLIEIESACLTTACRHVAAILQRLDEHALDFISESVPAFDSVMLRYDFIRFSCEEVIGVLLPLLSNLTIHEMAGNEYQLPICYDTRYSPDLHIVAKQTGFTPEEIIETHLQTTFSVMMTGFMPGFAYLGELPTALTVQRKTAPRLRVEEGAVGLAGRMTGIYSTNSPGGWQIIGKSINLLRYQIETGVRFTTGDQVQFYQVSARVIQKMSAS